MHRIAVVVGPTAVGKSEYATEIARRFDGEIISADSVQVYRGFDIGSAKPSEAERADVRHHLTDCADPTENFSAAEYGRRAREAVLDIASRGRLPVVAGGAGLYVNALLYDMDFSGPGREDVRRRLTEEAAQGGAAALHDRLRARDPAAAERIHANNVRRVIRALEILECAGETALRPFSEAFRRWEGCLPVIIELSRERRELYARIERRADGFFEAGLVEEVRGLLAGGLTGDETAMSGIGYKEVVGFLRGEYDEDHMRFLVKRNSRRYAKRQITWFRRYPARTTFDLSAYERNFADPKRAALRDIFACIENLYT